MSNFIIDFQSKQLTLLDSRFYTTEAGGWVPSVTTILEAYPKDYGYYQWLKSVGEDADAIRDEAGRRGSVVHELTERYDNHEEVTLLNDSGNLNVKMTEWAMFERYVEFATRHPHDTLMVEQTFVSEAFGFAGTIDRIMDIGGLRLVVDIKTSNAMYPSYWLQLAAYQKLVETETDMRTDGVAILWLNAKTRTYGKNGDIQGPGWQLAVRRDTAQDWELFKATQMLWLAQNKDAQPKRLSYQISYKK